MSQAIFSNREQFDAYILENSCQPLFLCGDAASILSELPDKSIDFCMTSPPYWGQREYSNGGIGLEETLEDYIDHLLVIFGQIRRVLKESGSFWLNIGDAYINKGLIGLPWRIAIALIDEQQWIMRNDVVWNKMKGPDNSKDKLRSTHEYVFHFVKRAKDYYYDVNSIRSRPREAKIINGAVVSATGVTGVRYKRQIELSTALTAEEKENAFRALEDILEQVANGKISDFRMVIRNQQRTTHSNSEKLSGRAKELVQKGYYFLKYHPDGSKPSDVWDIVPEDTQGRENHYAAYPLDLCRIPILATCPKHGIVLDPFCGTGTTNFVALSFERKSIGIDMSHKYIELSEQRCRRLL